jgi:hypothetical protein
LAALPTLGRSIMLGAISGAVTMKMISSTSMTSMNGTMLISLMVRRTHRPAGMNRTEQAWADTSTWLSAA